jgi:hypothetical protein
MTYGRWRGRRREQTTLVASPRPRDPPEQLIGGGEAAAARVNGGPKLGFRRHDTGLGWRLEFGVGVKRVAVAAL